MAFKFFVILIAYIAFSSVSNVVVAKGTKDTIFTIETFNGDYYYIGKNECSTGRINYLLENYPETQELLYSSISKSNWSYLTAWGGVVLGSYLIYDVIHYYNVHDSSPFSSNLNSQYTLATALVIGCELVAIMLNSSSKRDFKQAINIYNQKILSTNSGFEIHYNITSIGLSYHF